MRALPFVRTVCASLALSLVPALGCGGKMEAKVEYPEGTDFTQYSSYRWLTDDLVLIQTGTGNDNVRNVENEKRIRAAVDQGMLAKGLAHGGDDAELVVAFTVGTQVRYRLEGGTTSTIITDGPGGTVTRGTLTLYIFDPKTNVQIWEAWTSKDLQPGSDPEHVINEAVSLLLAEFPPS